MLGQGCAYEADSIQLYDWMWAPHGLGLTVGTIELVLFARIYSYSHHQAGLFYEPASRTAELLNVSRRSICSAIKSLTDRGLIVQRGTYRHGSNQDCPKYAVSQKAIDEALIRMQEALAPASEKAHPTPSPSPKERAVTEPAPSTPPLSAVPDVGAAERQAETAAARQTPAETDMGFKLLLEADANGGHSSVEQTYAAYRRAIEAGYRAEDILGAYRSYLDNYLQTHPNDGPRYVMRLEKFLTTGKGLRFYAQPREKGKSEKADSKIEAMYPRETTCIRCGNIASRASFSVAKRSATYICNTCVAGFTRSVEQLRLDDST